MKAEGRRQKAKGKIQNWVVAVFLLSGVGCGYQFSGKGEAFPKDVHNIFVESFVNKTREVGIDREITSALRSELRHRGQLRVVDRLEDADAILSGVVRSFDTRMVAVNHLSEAIQFEMALVLDMSLRRRSPDEILWRTQQARFSELFSGSRGATVTTSSDFKSRTLNAGDVPQFTDVQLTETLKQESRDRLVEEAARELHARFLEMF